MFSRLKSKNIIRICFLFLAAFFVGTGAAFLHDHFFQPLFPPLLKATGGSASKLMGIPLSAMPHLTS